MEGGKIWRRGRLWRCDPHADPKTHPPPSLGGNTSSSSPAAEHNNEVPLASYVLTNYYELLNIPMDATASNAEKVAHRPGVLQLLTPNSFAH